MAVYVPPGRRRNLTAAIAAAALVVGVAAGFGLGRGTAETVTDRVADARSSATDLVSALGVLPLEYEQAQAGTSETSQIADTVDRAAGGLADTLDQAPWFGDVQRQRLTAAIATVRDAAERQVSPAQFKAVVARANAVIRSEYGLPAVAGDGS
jgi:hypothetical protein